MSFISDNFISYDNEFTVKQEKLSVHDDSLHEFDTSESTPPYPISMTQTLQNLLNVNDQGLTLDPFHCYGSNQVTKKQPFKIIRANCEEIRKNSYESFEVKIECEEKLVSRTKRIQKREKAKQRLKVKQEASSPILSSVNSKYIPEGFDNPDLDEKTRRKMVQMIRNRISAQSSRDRKKAYMMQLEDAKALLAEENSKICQEKESLMKQLKKLEKTQRKLQSENQELKKNMEKTCQKCGQSKCNPTNKDQCSNESFSQMLSTLTGNDMMKFSEGNKSYKKAMTLATMISIMMVMNIVQQGNSSLMQGESEKVKGVRFSDFDRKTLQEAVAANFEGGEDEGLSDWGLIEQIMPLIRKFEENHKTMQQETQVKSSLETSASQVNLIKLEDNGGKFQTKIEYFGKRNGMMDEEKKSHPSSFFGSNEGKMSLEEELDSEIKAFGLDKPEFLQTLFKTKNAINFEDEGEFLEGFGKLLQKDNTNNLFGSWSKVIANNCFSFN